MIKPAICIPVTDTSVSEMKKTIREIEKQADFIELRVDYIENVSIEDLEILSRITKKQTIFTCRSQQEKGMFSGSEDERRNILEKALTMNFTYVDIELETMNDHAFQPMSKIILSYHNFEETPQYWDLTKIIDEMSSYSPAVYKIATTVKSQKDVDALFRLLTTKQGKTMIVAGMGEHGKIVRVLSPYIGNLLTFASYKKESAPGQINYQELQKIYKLIEDTI
jgi:3-dehydroquinate dehydratase type I